MIDFHIHIGTNGLLPAEALRRAALCGCRAAGLVLRTDGGDLRHLPQMVAEVQRLSLFMNIEAFAGVELAHVPPALLPDAVRAAREAGAELVLVHGETLADGVADGTNLAAVDAGADILAHPGLVDEQVSAYAAEKGVALELSACPRHGLANGHVAAQAQRFGCALVPGSAARAVADFTSRPAWKAVCRGAAMSQAMQDTFRNNAENLVKRLIKNQKKRKL